MPWATDRILYETADGLFSVILGAGGAPNVAIRTNRGLAIRRDGAVGSIYYETANAGVAWSAITATGTTDFGAGGIKSDAIVESTLDAGVTMEGFKLEDETTSRTIATSNVPVVWTHAANSASDDLTIDLTGAFDSSLILQSAGTGSDAISLRATAGGINVDAAGLVDVDVTGAIEVDATGAISVESSGGTLNIGADNVAQAVNVGTGGARAVVVGNSAAASLKLEAGIGALDVDADGAVTIDAGGAISVESSGGAIGIGTNAVAQAVNIGTGAAARVITIGNAASASIAIEGGVGGLTAQCDTTMDLDSGGALSLNSSGGAINIGNDAVAQAVNVATGAAARVITIGNAASASLKLEAGIGGLDVDADTTIELDAGGNVTIESSAGTIGIGADAVAQAINIGTAGARPITIGSAAANGVDIDAGTDDLNLTADDDVTITAGLSSTWSIDGNDAGTLTLTIDCVNAGAGIGVVAVTADNNVDLCDDAGNPTLTLQGTGNIIVSGATKRIVDGGAAELLLADDDVLIIADPADSTKRARLDAGAVTAGQTRVVTVPDRDLNLGRLDVQELADPGTGAAIPVDASYSIALTTGAGAETNTLAVPTFVGQRLSINLGTAGGGTRTITVASAFNQAGNTQIAFTQAQDCAILEGVRSTGAGVLAWKLVLNDGLVLA
jgi:hypothetical protein